MGAVTATDRDTTTGLVDEIGSKIRQISDTLLPPDKRAAWWDSLKAMAASNQKITAFLLTHVVLSGPPLLLFIGFTVTVFTVSLVTALLTGIIAAFLFTAFMLLIALFVVLPTLLITTTAATFLFVWGLGGYYIIKWFNKGETPAESRRAIGDSLDSMSGRRLTWLMDAPKRSPTATADSTKDGLLNGHENGISSKNMAAVTSKSPPKEPSKINGQEHGSNPDGLT